MTRLCPRCGNGTHPGSCITAMARRAGRVKSASKAAAAKANGAKGGRPAWTHLACAAHDCAFVVWRFSVTTCLRPPNCPLHPDAEFIKLFPERTSK